MKTKEVKRAEAIIRQEQFRQRRLAVLQEALKVAEGKKDKKEIASINEAIKDWTERPNQCVPKVGNRQMRLTNGRSRPMVDRSVWAVMGKNPSLVPSELLGVTGDTLI